MGAQERRVRQKPLLRQEILDAARDILAREGHEGLSMRKVARRIEYSPTAIYLHFKDRDDLVFSVCEQFMDGLAKELQQVADRHADPLVALKNVLRRYVEFGLKHPRHYQATFGIPQPRRREGGAVSSARDVGDADVRVPAATGRAVRQAEEAGEGGRPHRELRRSGPASTASRRC